MMFQASRHWILSLAVAAVAVTGSLPVRARAQMMMQGSGPGGVVRIFNTDMAILEAREARQDLPCVAVPLRSVLGFDMRFHSGFEVTVPLRELAGSDNLLSMVFRVVPKNHPEAVAYFVHRVKVPAIQPDAKGDASLFGHFDVGEGGYQVDWLMRDRAERVCSSFWDIEAQLPARDKDVVMNLAAGRIEESDREQFKDEPLVERSHSEPPLHVKVLVNFAPQNSSSFALQPVDTNALTAILRSIAREPRILTFTVVAFSMQQQRVIYRQDNVESIDFPSLGDAVNSLRLGTVDLRRLGEKNSDMAFLMNLISQELAPKEHPDAVIFAGPKVMLDQSIPPEMLKQVGEIEYPVFYMNYNFNPQANPWRDAIGNAVKFLKGSEYTISRPRDLFYAWKEIVSKAVSMKLARRVGTSTSP